MSSLSKDIYASIIFSDSAISLTLKIDFSKAMHLMSSNYIWLDESYSKPELCRCPLRKVEGFMGGIK